MTSRDIGGRLRDHALEHPHPGLHGLHQCLSRAVAHGVELVGAVLGGQRLGALGSVTIARRTCVSSMRASPSQWTTPAAYEAAQAGASPRCLDSKARASTRRTPSTSATELAGPLVGVTGAH